VTCSQNQAVVAGLTLRLRVLALAVASDLSTQAAAKR